jgi:putative nucleotidyltransferase with HDIG domain
MRKLNKIDVLGNKKISRQDLSEEIRCEIDVLGGLDIFTDAHVQGVVKTTTRICEEMGLNYEDLKKCVLCAYLHDVGKIRIPSAILQKNGKLTDEEFAEMKMHTVYGYEICMQYQNFRDLAPIVRAHHESFDGSGYPDGLVGSQIPFESSIIKVADVYDALTQRRQYKEGYKQTKALDIMLGDARKNKMSAKIMVYLMRTLLKEVEERITTHENNISQLKENLETLHELEKIYKSIYDRGYSNKSARQLARFDLPAGYDMSTNANLLIVKQKALEKEREWLDFCKNEYKLMKKQEDEIKSIARRERVYRPEVYERWFNK